MTSPSYRLTRLPILEDVPKFVVPIEVIGPANFTLFAVWTEIDPQYRYVRGAVKAVQMYREVFAGSPCVLMGDFNSNAAEGEETRPPYYHRWNPKEPFHIDYCFMPAAWIERVRKVEVSGYEEWKGSSDHRPLVVDVDFNSGTGADPEAGGASIAR